MFQICDIDNKNNKITQLLSNFDINFVIIIIIVFYKVNKCIKVKKLLKS